MIYITFYLVIAPDNDLRHAECDESLHGGIEKSDFEIIR